MENPLFFSANDRANSSGYDIISRWAAVIGGVIAVALVIVTVISVVVIRLWLHKRRRNLAHETSEGADGDDWNKGSDADSGRVCGHNDLQVK